MIMKERMNKSNLQIKAKMEGEKNYMIARIFLIICEGVIR